MTHREWNAMKTRPSVGYTGGLRAAPGRWGAFTSLTLQESRSETSSIAFQSTRERIQTLMITHTEHILFLKDASTHCEAFSLITVHPGLKVKVHLAPKPEAFYLALP